MKHFSLPLFSRLMAGALCCLLIGNATQVLGQVFPALGGQRAGISALTFLKMEASPRAAALGGTTICLTGDGYSTYTNPAALAEVKGVSAAVSNTSWAGGVNFAFASVAKPFSFGSLGVSAASLNSGAMPVRTEFQPDGTGELTYASATKVAATYSKRLTDMFCYGFNVAYVHEQLGTLSANTATVDMGFLYQTDFKDLRFAVMLQNFGPNSTLKGTFGTDSAFVGRKRNIDGYPAPTVFKLGVSAVPYKNTAGDQSVTVTAQLDHPNDNAENIRLGAEYNYKSLLYLRAGYKINVADQDFPTFGAGLRMRMGRHPLRLDYAYDRLTYLGTVHRIGLCFQVMSDKE